MDFKQSTIPEILDSEREMVRRGGERYGAYFDNAFRFTGILGTGMIKSISADRFIFALFLSHVRKHLMLALFSAVRLHHVQALMNLRQVLEAGACAAYAIAHTDAADFADVNADGTLDPTEALKNKRYKWLAEHYPAGSEGMKGMKDAINKTIAHANIVSAQHNFNLRFEDGRFDTPFFDFEDEIQVKTDLWQIGNIALGVLDLFYGINAASAGFVLQDDWHAQFKVLVAEDTRLKQEMLAHERYKKFAPVDSAPKAVSHAVSGHTKGEAPKKID
jgi:hypothetical protein